MDMLTAVKAFNPNPEQPFRIRQATCVSVEAGYTCTVTIAGDTVEVPNVRYMHAPPRPGTSCFVATDGYEIFVLGQIAGYSAIPHFTGTRTSATTIPDGGAIVGLSVDVVDPWEMWSIGGNAAYTVPCDGVWVAEASVRFAASSTGNRGVAVYKNGVGPPADVHTRQQNLTAGTPAVLSATRVMKAVKGDLITFFAYQNTGGGLQATAASGAVTYVGPAE